VPKQVLPTTNIKITIVEPGFFRTDLLDSRNIKWGTNRIDDYAAEGSVQDMWSPYHGKQQGDPIKLGEALVKLARMENPPKIFVAGSDALTMIPPAIEDRLQEVRAYEALSRSTDGTF
jgi:NAD(P)-dependent dehydrogenase (short-subunit alcohol dehydrogenase family)